MDGRPAVRADTGGDTLAQPNQGEASSALIAASVLTLIASATGMVIGLLRSKLLAVLLGPSGVGILANLGIYNTFVSTAGTAFAGQGSTRAIAVARADGRDDHVDWLIRYSFLIPPAVGLFILGGTVALAPQVSELVMGDPQYAPLVAISAMAIPLTLLGTSYAGVLQGFVRIGSLAKASIATTIISLVVIAALILLFGLTGAVVAGSIVALVQLGIFFAREPWVIRGRRWRRRLNFNWLALGPVLQLGSASVVLTIVGTLVTLLIRSDIVRVLGIDQNGIYQPVSAISDTYLEVLISSTSLYLFPRLTELLRAGRRSEAADEVGHGLRMVLAVTVPLLLLLIAFGEPIVVLLYSDKFRPAADPLAIQMAGNILKVITWTAAAALLPLGYYRAWLLIGLSQLAIKYLGTHLLLPALGLQGVAIAYDLCWAWTFAVEMFVVVAIGRVGPRPRDWRHALIAVALVGGTFAAYEMTHILGMLVAVTAVVVWFAVSRDDLADLVRTLNAIARPRLLALRRRRNLGD
jgi:PST family polysaccharide transporter